MTEDQKQQALINLMEEAAEIVQAVSKWMRFGAEATDPNNSQAIPANVRLAREIGNMMAMVEILGNENLLSDDEIRVGYDKKFEAMKHYGVI